MKNWLRRFLVLLVIAGALAGGFRLWQSRHPEKSRHELVLYGNVDIRQVQLAFNNSERLVAMEVKEGDRVKAGQLLAKLETDRLQYAVAQSEGQVESQSAVVARLEEGSRPEEIRSARAELNAALAEAAKAESQARRRKPLAAQNAISKEEAQITAYSAEAALARVNGTKEALALAVEGPRKEDIASAKAALRSLEAQRELAKKKLADAFLYAPSDGVIQDRILEPGDMVSPQRPLYTLALTDPVWVRAYLSEPDLGRIWPGMTATISTDSYPGKEYPAWVGFVSPTAQFTPKTVETTEVRTTLVYQVRIYACNPLGELRLGMPATVTIPLSQPKTDANLLDERCKKEQ